MLLPMAEQRAVPAFERGLGRLVAEGPDVVACFDRGLRHLYVNRAVSELIGRRIDDLAGPDMDVAAAWKAFLETGELAGEFTLRRSDGQVRVVDYRARAHFAPGRHLSILRDVSERQQVDRALDLERR